MTSPYVRRLESRVAQTAARIVDHATREQLDVADLPNLRLPWYAIRNQTDATGGEDDGAATVFLFDEIGGSLGIQADQFVRDLDDIDAPVIHLRINSPGGSLFDAIAIHSALLHHPAKVVAYVDSLAASAASVVAMAGDEIVMMPGSQMMIHDAAMVQDGNAAEMAKASTFLDRQSGNVADLYAGKAGGDAQEWRELMLAETWMFADEAVDLGLADRVQARPAPAPEPELEEAMTRSFDLAGRYRYTSRRTAPAPRRHRTGIRVPAQVRERGSATVVEPVQLDRRAAAHDRAQAYRAAGIRPAAGVRSESGIPLGLSRSVPFGSRMGARMVSRDDRNFVQVEGYATVFGVRYEMWDEFGPYDESVARGAADETLAANPDVIFLVNHRGLSMARTAGPGRAGTLELSADSTGMSDLAWLNPERSDVKDLKLAIDDEVVTEQSFGFMITEGRWNGDFTHFEIVRFDIHRGDVSAVNYGASPSTSIAARQRDIFGELDRMPAYAARAAMTRLAQRYEVPDLGITRGELAEPPPDRETAAAGRSIAHIEALLLDE